MNQPPRVQLATFFVGDEEYALDIMRIKEIINPVRITPVPRAPEFVDGVIELRGAVLPVIDLRKRFDVAPRVLAGRRTIKYVIVGIDRRVVGLVVDAVGEVLRLHPDEVRPPPGFALAGAGGADVGGEDGTGAGTVFQGVVHRRRGAERRIVMVLDLDGLLSSRERISLGRMGGTA